MSRAVIFVNGHLPHLELLGRLVQPGDFLIAADGGTRHILALGLIPSVVIGDLDSLNEKERLRLDTAGIEIRRVPRDKEVTDFELALQYAVEAGFSKILVVAALGNRLDQTLGNLALLTNPSLDGFNIRFDDGEERACFTRTQAMVEGHSGDIVSLIPWGGKATGVVTDGLRWPLRSETLYPYKTRGISNELLGESASVSLKSGLLLIIQGRYHQS